MPQTRYPLILTLLLVISSSCLALTARVKDLAVVAGARDNQLVGYGLISGIAGDGDRNPVYTLQSIANLLQRHGISIPTATLSSKNVAAVMVTADIPAFKKPGSRIDVTVSSMGDAKTLQGGILLQTPLIGADGTVYAVAQGPVAIGGVSAGPDGGGGATVQKNHPTTGQIISGALIEREIPTEIVHDNMIELLLREPDFTSASRLAATINQTYPESARPLDSTTVAITMPAEDASRPVDFIASIESLEVEADVPARIIINERTGTIVATSHIRIASCAVAHGNLTITIASTLNVSQPNAFSPNGSTVVTPSTDTQVAEQRASLVPLPDMPTVDQVASSLNALGLTPRDTMAIFQAMKQAGALQAELIMR